MGASSYAFVAAVVVVVVVVVVAVAVVAAADDDAALAVGMDVFHHLRYQASPSPRHLCSFCYET